MALLILHIIATAVMTGVIWFVQLVHYPEFRWTAPSHFVTCMKHHQRFTSLIVGPVMLVEGVTGGYLLLGDLTPLNPLLLWINAAGILVTWCCTYFLSIPRHKRLLLGYDLDTIESLISTNWPRSFLWSSRCFLLMFLLKNGEPRI